MKCSICGVNVTVKPITDICTICNYKLGEGYLVEELKEMRA